MLAEKYLHKLMVLRSGYKLAVYFFFFQINRAPSIEIAGLGLIPKPLNITEENLETVYRALDCLLVSVYNLHIDNSEQIMTDMRGLKRIVKSLASTQDCSSPLCGTKDQLKVLIQKYTAFAVTIRYTVLDRLEMYLQRLIRLLRNPLSCNAAPLETSIRYIF